MLYLIILIALFALVKLEIIPARKWFYLGCALAVSEVTRWRIKIRAWLEKMVA